MNFIKSLIEKYQFRKVVKKYESQSVDMLIKTFSNSYHLTQSGISWDVSEFNRPVKVFNLSGSNESYKYPNYFVLLDENNTCYMFCGLQTGYNKHHKESGDFKKFDKAFVDSMKNFMVANSDNGKDAILDKVEERSVCIHMNSFQELYLTAVCNLNRPNGIILLDKRLSKFQIKDKIKEKAISQHVNIYKEQK